MSTIKIEITLDSSMEMFDVILNALARKDVKNIEVVEAEEVKAPEKKAAAPRPSRAKAKPEPVIEEEEEEEDEDLLGEEAEDDETEELSADDVKAMLAKKVTTHRDVIVKKMNSYGAARLSELDSANYREFYDFMAKLK